MKGFCTIRPGHRRLTKNILHHIFWGPHCGPPISETLYMISTSCKGRPVSFVSIVSFVHLLCQNIFKKYKMGNCLSKCANKPFTLRTPPLTSGHLKKAISGIQNKPRRIFCCCITSKSWI